MDIENIYLKEDINLINLKTAYRSEEEYGVSDLYKLAEKGELTCDLVEVKFDNKTIPMLVFNNKRHELSEIGEINGGEIINKLKIQKSTFKDNISNRRGHFFYANRIKGRLEKETFLHQNDLFLASFHYGETLIIAPNPYVLSFKEDELNCKQPYRKCSIKKVNQEEIIERVKERRKKIFAQSKKNISTIYKMFQEHGMHIGGASGPFHSGINMYFLPKEDLEILRNYQILPFEFIEDENKFVRYDKEKLNQIITERIDYLNEEESFIKELDLVKEKLKGSGKRWYSLDRVTKIKSTKYREFEKSTWHVWLNPIDQQVYKVGWYTLEDLNLWLEDKGPIIKIFK